MTAIEWTDETWNPVTGCDRVSPGCDNCYALSMAKRLKAMGQPKYQNDGDPRTSGPGFRLTCHPGELTRPLTWRKPRRVFVNSMSDLFHHDVPRSFIVQTWAAMALAPQHTFQVLTKRPQRAHQILADLGALPNVWLGTSIESDRYTFRADHLRRTPAAVRFLSLEPLLGPLPSLDLTDIDWVIVGGESGQDARPMHPDWVRDIRDRCIAADVPFFFKQRGSWTWSLGPDEEWFEPSWYVHVDGRVAQEDEVLADLGSWQGVWNLGKKRAGRELDDRTWDEMPAVAR